jgi:hypothetical protein
MRFSVIKYEEEETVYYNPKTFYRDEDMIIFPFKEFDNFYNEIVQNLNVVKVIISDALNSNTPHPPLTDLERIEDWINFIGEDVDLLLKFKMQSTLELFQTSNSARIKPPKLKFMGSGNHKFPQPPLKPPLTTPQMGNKLPPYPKEEIQCLIGL